MYSTPTQSRTRYSSGSSTPSRTPSTPAGVIVGNTTRHSALESRKALGLNRDKGTPVGKVLARELGSTPRSPRKIRQRNWVEKAQDWPSNLLLHLETSISLWTLDPAGYPIAIGLTALHLMTRLPLFVTAFTRGGRSILRATSSLADASERLEALKKQAERHNAPGWGTTLTTCLSLLLVAVSMANATYIATRRRQYQLVLRRDPLASPNARSTRLDFSPTKSIRASFYDAAKKYIMSFIWTAKHEEEQETFRIQQLDVWTPDYFKWSLRIFSLYPPPVALMYHFLKPSNFFYVIICGGLLVAQTFILIQLYTTLLSDRSILQSEVMHEYNAKFVNPRLFVQKKDAATSTSEAEFISRDEWRRSPTLLSHNTPSTLDDAIPPEVVRGTSARKSRSRTSTATGR